MAADLSTKNAVTDAPVQWNESVVKKAYSHMRIHFRQVSPAVRNMVLQECMADLDPKQGVEGLVDCIEAKLNLP